MSIELQRYVIESITDEEVISILDDLFLMILSTSWKKCHRMLSKEFLKTLMIKYDYNVMPIVDNEDRLVGIITRYENALQSVIIQAFR